MIGLSHWFPPRKQAPRSSKRLGFPLHFGLLLAAGPVIAVLWSGCIDATCSTDAHCADSEYCPLAVGACLLANPIPSACKPRPEGCTTAVLEVCGCDGETHESACVAAQAGTSVAFEGPCEEPEPEPEPEPVVGCGDGCADGEYCELPTGACVLSTAEGSCQPIPEGCIDEVKSLVCGCDGLEYDSPCHAAMAQVQVFAEGSCACTAKPDTCPDGSFCQLGVGGCFDAEPTGVCKIIPATCPVAYVPVCGCNGVNYINACRAAAVGENVAAAGVCLPDP